MSSPDRSKWIVRLTASLALTATLCTMGCQSDPGPRSSQTLANPANASPSTPPEQVAAGLFDQKHPDRRRQALVRISHAPFGGESAYLKAYRKLTRDPSPTVRAAAAGALAKRGKVEDAGVLADMLDDPSAFVRWQAAKGLQGLHNPAVVDSLIAATRDDEGDVRLAAAKALGQYPRSLVFETLVGKLTDNDYAVKRAARQSLVTLTGIDRGPGPKDWLDWAQQNRESLFAGQQPYTYLSWTAPPTWWQRLVWLGFAHRPSPQPHQPTGI